MVANFHISIDVCRSIYIHIFLYYSHLILLHRKWSGLNLEYRGSWHFTIEMIQTPSWSSAFFPHWYLHVLQHHMTRRRFLSSESCRSTEISCRCLNDDVQNLSSELEFTDTKVCQRIIQRSLCSSGRLDDRCELAMLMSNDIARRACSDGWFSIRCWDLVGAWYIFSNRVVRRCSTI